MKWSQIAIVGASLSVAAMSSADEIRVLPKGQAPKDSRLGPLRTLDDYFPFTKIASAQEWEKRAASLRRRAQLATGLWPMPTKTPLQAVVHGKVERDEYTVEKVYFQSFPGHYVTGSLYRPKNPAAKNPGVLCPHGHWQDGRFHDHGEEAMKKELATGGEKFESGRHPLQARCVHLARMGCVVFHYDMIGYADSVQMAHRPGVREAMNTKENWGFFSPAAELRLQNMMGLQTYNSVRALDFLLSLPDVDPGKIGVTGASGGGTQTFMLSAVDPRPTVLFPAVMVCTGMQGGCTCENAPYLRINAGNIDIAGLAAPRPLGMTAADDWTKEMETKGFPDLKALYEMVGAPGKVGLFPYLQYPHNYNSPSRHAMYGWFHKHLLGKEGVPAEERPFKPLSREEMSVWNAEHPKPKVTGDEHERQLTRWWAEDADRQLGALETRIGTDAKALEEYRSLLGGAWKTIVGREMDEVGPVEWELATKTSQGDVLVMSGLLSATKHGEQLPALFLHPKDRWNGEVVISLDLKGKGALLEANGKPAPEAAALVAKGFAVMSVDVLGTGEFLTEKQDGQRVGQYGKGSEAWQKSAIYTFGYNPPLFVRRVHDALTSIEFVRKNPKWTAKKIHLVGPAPIVAAAAMQAGPALTKVVAKDASFRFGAANAFTDENFVPGAVKYRDLPGLLALCAPTKLLVGVGNAPDSATLPSSVYSGARAAQDFVWTNQVGVAEVMAWLGDG